MFKLLEVDKMKVCARGTYVQIFDPPGGSGP